MCKMNSVQAEVMECQRAEWVARQQTEALVKTIGLPFDLLMLSARVPKRVSFWLIPLMSYIS